MITFCGNNLNVLNRMTFWLCGYVDVWHSAAEAVIFGYVVTRPRETQPAATVSATVIHICCETSPLRYCAIKVTDTTKWDDRYTYEQSLSVIVITHRACCYYFSL